MPGGGFSRVAADPLPSDPSVCSNVAAAKRFKLGDFAVDEYRPIRVIVIGAGFSGILAGIRYDEIISYVVDHMQIARVYTRLPQKIPNVEMAIYEKSADVGGTWYNNRYP